MRRILILSICFALAACGFQPLHSQAYRAQQSVQLAALQVQVDNTRLGQLLEAEISDDINPDYQRVPKTYRLEIELKSTTVPLFINPDGTSARGDIQYNTTYKLVRIADSAVMDSGTLSRTSSYNTSDQASQGYASFVSIEDAKKRGVIELGQDYKLRMANLLAQLGAAS